MIYPKKELARNRSEPAQLILALLQISSDSYDDIDGGGSSGARCSRCARCNNRRTDKGGSIRTGNSRIHKKDSSDTHSSDNRTQFRLKPVRQNAAPEQKPIRLPSMQLTEAFSL